MNGPVYNAGMKRRFRFAAACMILTGYTFHAYDQFSHHVDMGFQDTARLMMKRDTQDMPCSAARKARYAAGMAITGTLSFMLPALGRVMGQNNQPTGSLAANATRDISTLPFNGVARALGAYTALDFVCGMPANDDHAPATGDSITNFEMPSLPSHLRHFSI